MGIQDSGRSAVRVGTTNQPTKCQPQLLRHWQSYTTYWPLPRTSSSCHEEPVKHLSAKTSLKGKALARERVETPDDGTAPLRVELGLVVCSEHGRPSQTSGQDALAPVSPWPSPDVIRKAASTEASLTRESRLDTNERFSRLVGF